MEDKMAMVEFGCNELQMAAETKFVHHGDLTQVSQTLNDALERMDLLDQEVQQTQAQVGTLGTTTTNSEQRARNEPQLFNIGYAGDPTEIAQPPHSERPENLSPTDVWLRDMRPTTTVGEAPTSTSARPSTPTPRWAAGGPSGPASTPPAPPIMGLGSLSPGGPGPVEQQAQPPSDRWPAWYHGVAGMMGGRGW